MKIYGKEGEVHEGDSVDCKEMIEVSKGYWGIYDPNNPNPPKETTDAERAAAAEKEKAQ